MTAPTFNNSYFITNRSDPETIWVDSASYVTPGDLSYYMSNTQYDQSPDDYSTTNASNFLSSLQADLQNTVDSNGNANLAVYIHGLGNTFDDAITESAAFGSALGITGGFIYKDKSIMDTMVRVFNAEQEKAIATAARLYPVPN